MRVVHVILRLAEIDGGPPTGLTTLARAQAELGDEVTVVPSTSDGGKPVIEPGEYGRLTVIAPPASSSLKLPDRAVKECLVSLVQGQADVVHIHGAWRYHSVAASSAARAAGVPYLVRPAGNLGAIPRGSKAYLKKPYYWLIEKPVIRRAAAIHCCTAKELREIEQLRLNVPAFVVPQPVDGSLGDAEVDPNVVREMFPEIRPEATVLLFLGRVAWIKRLPVLVEAFGLIAAEFADAHLIIAGPWEDQDVVSDLQDRIAALNVSSRVWLPGMVGGATKVALLKRAAVFVQPSSHENFGISVAEALRVGRPCVVSHGVALAEEIDAVGAGIRYVGHADELAEALRRMLSDKPFRDACGGQAERLARSFTPVAVAEQLKEKYERIIRNG